MAVHFTAGPSKAERARAAKARRAQERERRKREREAYERAQRAREEAYWSRFRSGGAGFASSSSRIAAEDKDMANELINAGYRALSRKHHPDAGGSHEAMVKVNRALDALRKMVS